MHTQQKYLACCSLAAIISPAALALEWGESDHYDGSTYIEIGNAYNHVDNKDANPLSILIKQTVQNHYFKVKYSNYSKYSLGTQFFTDYAFNFEYGYDFQIDKLSITPHLASNNDKAFGNDKLSFLVDANTTKKTFIFYQ